MLKILKFGFWVQSTFWKLYNMQYGTKKITADIYVQRNYFNHICWNFILKKNVLVVHTI